MNDVGRVGKRLHPALPRRSWRVIKIAVSSIAFILSLGWFHWSVGIALLLSLLVATSIGLLDGRLSIALGLLCLVCCPLLLFAEQQAWLQQSTLVAYYAANLGLLSLSGAADQLAVWAYYLLCIGVFALIVQRMKGGNRRGW